MIKGTTPSFTLKFNDTLPLSQIESYCVSIGRNDKRGYLDIYESAPKELKQVDGMYCLEFERGSMFTAESESSAKPRPVVFTFTLLEEESLALKVGTAYMQLKVGLSGDKVISSKQMTFEVEDSLCEKGMKEHE